MGNNPLMIKAGWIVWVLKRESQMEIVNHPLLIYNNVEDAVNKIEEVLKDETLQVKLREHLASQVEKFSVNKFKKEIKELVGDFFGNE
jgi:glycosyltransferase involved in cell wall biosynthesis